MSDRQQRYSAIAILLHWIIAALLAFELGLGRGLEHLTLATGLFDVTQLHKSIGITILLLSIARLGWRLLNPPPAPLPDSALNHVLAKTVHIGLYAFMIGAPLSGWLMVSTSKLDIDTLLFSTIPWPDIPWVGGLEASAKEALNGAAEWVHGALGWVGVALFALHVVGALRHHLLRGEPLLGRILPGAFGLRPNRGAMVIGLFALASVSLTLWAQNWGGGKAETPAPLAAEDMPATQTLKLNELQADAVEDEEPEATEATEDAEEEDDAAEDEAEDNAEQEEEPEEPATTAYDWRVTNKQPIGFAFVWNGETVRGSFSDWNATIRFGEQALDQSNIDVSIGLASARTGNAQVDEALPGADFFAIAANPRARFRSNDIRSLGGNRYEARGNLSLRGSSQPVTLRFTLDIDGTTASANGNASVNRAAFGIANGSYGDIADAVQVDFNFSASR
ncbi:YceI family protein [Alterisphingorhabdus coralli]|uniref:YceI family protein n=1 Tax=Alterisphingorhabdus coralli TaxID=3071408 RepID=A0AA97F941_9SPHN|nr:YceI family protein [Parasphingorhabdus sp. SCSIO 66989]WOE75801.1 YceI family protein [Parasphingorhabdus sp. SCSIO 66989]